jgi:transcriptional regulator with XRE-family HTH domain
MTGKHILDLMLQEGYSVNKMAELIGTSQPNLLSALKHTDVRTGLLEKIAQAMGKPLAFFYGEEFGVVSQITGSSNATAINNSTATAGNDDRLLTLLVNKDEQLTLAMKQTSKAQDQMDKAQQQMDRVLDKFLGNNGD